MFSFMLPSCWYCQVAVNKCIEMNNTSTKILSTNSFCVPVFVITVKPVLCDLPREQ